MATQVSSFSLSDGNDTSCVVTKFMTSNRGKQEIVTMGHYFRKCGENKCVPCNASNDGSMQYIA
jgi:hypothetical protein